MELREIQDGDWEDIARIQRTCFAPSAIETTEALRSISVLSPTTCLIACEEDVAVAYVLTHPWIENDLPALNNVLEEIPAGGSCLFLHDLAVLPSHRGKKIARSLVEEVLARAKARGFLRASLISVQGSEKFWEGFGFRNRPEVTERFRKHVEDFCGLDFYFMVAELPEC